MVHSGWGAMKQFPGHERTILLMEKALVSVNQAVKFAIFGRGLYSRAYRVPSIATLPPVIRGRGYSELSHRPTFQSKILGCLMRISG